MISGFDHVLLTQDWHPAGHSSFASSHAGKAAYAKIDTPNGVQTLWPDHCIQGTRGADFHPDLDWTKAELIIRKGFRKPIDTYSAFFEYDHSTPSGFAGYLRDRSITKLTLVGLATDVCVAHAALDAVKQGIGVTVRLDGCREVNIEGSYEKMLAKMREAGVELLQ